MLRARLSGTEPVLQVLALKKCELRVVQSSLIGSILSNICERFLFLSRWPVKSRRNVVC